MMTASQFWMSFWRTAAVGMEVTNLGQESENSALVLLQKIGLRYHPLHLELTMRDDSTNLSLYLQMSHTSGEEIHKNWRRLLAIVLNCGAWITDQLEGAHESKSWKGCFKYHNEGIWNSTWIFIAVQNKKYLKVTDYSYSNQIHISPRNYITLMF